MNRNTVDFSEVKRSLNRIKDRASRAKKMFEWDIPEPTALSKRERLRKWERAYKIVNDPAQTHISKINR